MGLVRNATPTSQLGRGIRKVAFICGEIKDLVSESDSHCAYMEDPENPDLCGEFEELNDEEGEELKREYVLLLFCLVSLSRLMHVTYKLGTQPRRRSSAQPPHPWIPEEDRRWIARRTKHVLYRGEQTVTLCIGISAH